VRQISRHGFCKLALVRRRVDQRRRRFDCLSPPFVENWVTTKLTVIRVVSLFRTRPQEKSLGAQAAEARSFRLNSVIALAAVLVYNIVGVLDIVSTIAAIELGRAEEANPLMRAIMDNHGPGWIGAKLFLQLVISGMVLWFPHRIVVAVFTLAITLNGLIVANNFLIAFGP
jgi:hypothetical protein